MSAPLFGSQQCSTWLLCGGEVATRPGSYRTVRGIFRAVGDAFAQSGKFLGAASLGFLFLVLTSTLLADPKSPETASKNNNQTEKIGADFFGEQTIRAFEFTIPEESLAQLRRSSRTYVSGEVTEGDHVLANVGIRLKGMGSFRGIHDKPSLAVKFDEFVEDQRYRGLKKLMFNNSAQDSTYLAELVATQLFRDVGLPAARVTHARVRLNGRDLGLYVVIEAMNKDFLKLHFGNGKGNLYETYLQDINGHVEQDNGDDHTQRDVRALREACMIPDATERWEQLNKVLDVDRFVSFVAMEMLTAHWDGYALKANNYRIYHDPNTDKMVFITHGLDGTFRRPYMSIKSPWKSLVTRAVLTTPDGEELYQERIDALFADAFKMPVIHRRMDEALAKLRRAGLDPHDLAEIERRAGLMRERIGLRASRVADQLRGIEPETMKFDAGGVGYPVSWRDEPGPSEAILDRVKSDGRTTLHIQARNTTLPGGNTRAGQTRSSWRSQIFLKPGWYRFEGLARTNLITSGSAHLRISGDTRAIGISGNTAWQSLMYDFLVQDEVKDVELVCELNAPSGDVWFDLDSLRVKQITARERPVINRRAVLQE